MAIGPQHSQWGVDRCFLINSKNCSWSTKGSENKIKESWTHQLNRQRTSPLLFDEFFFLKEKGGNTETFMSAVECTQKQLIENFDRLIGSIVIHRKD